MRITWFTTKSCIHTLALKSIISTSYSERNHLTSPKPYDGFHMPISFSTTMLGILLGKQCSDYTVTVLTIQRKIQHIFLLRQECEKSFKIYSYALCNWEFATFNIIANRVQFTQLWHNYRIFTEIVLVPISRIHWLVSLCNLAQVMMILRRI